MQQEQLMKYYAYVCVCIYIYIYIYTYVYIFMCVCVYAYIMYIYIYIYIHTYTLQRPGDAARAAQEVRGAWPLQEGHQHGGRRAEDEGSQVELDCDIYIYIYIYIYYISLNCEEFEESPSPPLFASEDQQSLACMRAAEPGVYARRQRPAVCTRQTRLCV